MDINIDDLDEIQFDEAVAEEQRAAGPAEVVGDGSAAESLPATPMAEVRPSVASQGAAGGADPHAVPRVELPQLRFAVPPAAGPSTRGRRPGSTARSAVLRSLMSDASAVDPAPPLAAAGVPVSVESRSR